MLLLLLLPLLLLLLLLLHKQDKHIDFATWPELKPQTPFGQVPVLQVDAQMIAQSAAIGEHRLLPLFGSDGHGPIRLGVHGGNVRGEFAAVCCQGRVYMAPGTPGVFLCFFFVFSQIVA
jgi:hypothetical protein